MTRTAVLGEAVLSTATVSGASVPATRDTLASRGKGFSNDQHNDKYHRIDVKIIKKLYFR